MSLMHHAILALVFFTVGCCVGSFLNVCVFRIPRRLSLLRPRSRCPRCLAAIRAYDNVPVLGWLFLRGRCRDCGCAISSRYPLVEFGVGLCFAGVYLAVAAVTSGELWERSGALDFLIPLLMAWTAISIIVVMSLTVRDARANSARLPHASGVGGQD
jgi:leader peptidase (prepilin peptidase) / N-methyltransferase